MTNRNRPNVLKQSLTEVERPGALISRRKALASLGRVLYAARIDGMVKIGCTTDLCARLDTLRSSQQAGASSILGLSRLAHGHGACTRLARPRDRPLRPLDLAPCGCSREATWQPCSKSPTTTT